VAVVNLANRCLVTPQLTTALEGAAHRPDGELWDFLLQVRERNRERNGRLWRQLAEAVASLNRAGVEPVLLKGAAILAAAAEPAAVDRVLSDLDLLVEPAQVEAAITALQADGFAVAGRYRGLAVHVVAELGRPQDVGYIDLHQRPPGPPGIAATPDLERRRDAIRVAGGKAVVPTPAAQLLHLVLHDQFHDGGYWRGGLDLRHLIDVRDLLGAISSAEFRWLRQACQTELVRAALDAQLEAARLFAGAATPPDAQTLHARLTRKRWRLQSVHPWLRLPLAGLAVALDGGKLAAHRRADRAGRVRVLAEHPSCRAPLRERLQRLAQLMTADSGKA
jgi:hypothetical protein